VHKTQQTLQMDLVILCCARISATDQVQVSSAFSFLVCILSLERNMLPNSLALRYSVLLGTGTLFWEISPRSPESIGDKTAYATGWIARGLNSDRRKIFFSSPRHPDRMWGPPNLIFSRSFPRVKRPGRQVYNSLQPVRITGAIRLLPVYAFMMQTETNLPLIRRVRKTAKGDF